MQNNEFPARVFHFKPSQVNKVKKTAKIYHAKVSFTLQNSKPPTGNFLQNERKALQSNTAIVIIMVGLLLTLTVGTISKNAPII